MATSAVLDIGWVPNSSHSKMGIAPKPLHLHLRLWSSTVSRSRESFHSVLFLNGNLLCQHQNQSLNWCLLFSLDYWISNQHHKREDVWQARNHCLVTVIWQLCPHQPAHPAAGAPLQVSLPKSREELLWTVTQAMMESDFLIFFFYFCEDAKATGMERRRRENMRIWLKVLERNMVGKISLSNVWSKEEVDAFYTTGCFVFLPLPNMLQLFKWDILNRICGIHTYIRIEIYIYKWTLISRFGDNLGSAINIPRVEYRLSFLTQRSQ